LQSQQGGGSKMNKTAIRLATNCALVMLLLTGCASIDLAKIKPNGANPSGKCLNLADTSTRSGAPGGASSIYGPLLLPREAVLVAPSPGAAREVPSFKGYVAASEAALNSLPTDIANDPVTQAFFKNVIKASAAAQLAGATVTAAPGGASISASELKIWKVEVSAYKAPAKVSWLQVLEFSRKLMGDQLLPALADPTVAGAGAPSPFEVYFRAYYEGKFVDRFGNAIQKPQLPNLSSLVGAKPVSLTITDADISAAESVLLEYLFDLIDPTPVLGDAANANAVTSATKFYPGGTAQSRPTVFGTGLARYMEIPQSGCGVTVRNIPVLVDIANAAGDRAAAIGGLSFNSVGGIGVSLGFLGKLSIGDNETLSTMAKEAISRFAMRLSYASAFWLIRDATTPPGGRAGVRTGPSYLRFQ
jgi:hypothetical protein